jgi:hypothetical protein
MRIDMKDFKLETHSKLVSNKVCFGERDRISSGRELYVTLLSLGSGMYVHTHRLTSFELSRRI